ncbi:hypothetical protein B0F90DRAFT_1632958, partial [Multifurca ochricompacta]
GISMCLSASQFCHGDAKLCTSNGQLWMALSATMFGTSYSPLSMKLIPLLCIFFHIYVTYSQYF